MGKVGRFICVGLPFALTIASLVCILIVGLAGITSNGLFMFQVNTKDLSISIPDLSGLTKRANHMKLAGSAFADTGADPTSLITTSNITAADLGLFDSYTISLWNYCYTSGTTTVCEKGKFDWASNATNITTTLTNIAEANGATFADKTLINAVKTFSNLVKWTEIVYIIAGVLAVLELIVGLFGFCSRIGSCCTYIVSGFALTGVIAAASMSTVTAAMVVGTVETLKKFGISASFNTSFLSLSWLAVVFSLAGSLFWLFSVCCCSAGHSARREKRRSRADDSEKVPYGSYQRVNDPFIPAHTHQETGYIPPTQPMAAQRYEPYSHAPV